LITIALVGPPNCGKTTMLNRLAHAREAVANYPRVTVTPRDYTITHRGRRLRLIDLPGIQSLSSHSPEERVGRDVIHFQRPDVVINILDAGALERSLFLTTQLIEMDVPRVHAFNMMDEARRQGISLDIAGLAARLGGPVVETVATTGEGVDGLLDRAVELAESPVRPSPAIGYESHLERAIERVDAAVRALHPTDLSARQSRWLAIKLLEGDSEILSREGEHPDLIARVEAERERFRRQHDEKCEHAMAGGRYGFIRGLLRDTRRVSPAAARPRRFDPDDLLLHPWAGLPILLLLMGLMFEATFELGGIPAQWIHAGVEWVGGVARGLLPDGLLSDLILDGVLAGIGGTIVFLPNVVILFFFLALFSETGYIARAAFLLDRLMHLFGLHGKALIPMVIGFGCNVPAIMATRTIESERSRLITALVTPFMCCSARLPLLMLFAGAMFTTRAGLVVFSLYLLGIAVALGSAVLLSRTVLRSMAEPFVMELPPYRLPTARGVLFHMWENATAFLRKVGSVILVGSVIIWFLQAFPRDAAPPQEATAAHAATARADPAPPAATADELRRAQTAGRLEASYLGRLGIAVSPVFSVLGFSWQDTVAILTGVIAKEAVIASYAVLYAQDSDPGDLQRRLAARLSPVQAYAFMVFVLLYLPCLSTMGALRRETGGWRWVAVSAVYSLTVAWGLAALIVGVGRLA